MISKSANNDSNIPDGQHTITILGSTGSIGINALDVVARHPDTFRIFSLTANTKVEKLFEQCCLFKPRFAVIGSETLRVTLAEKLANKGSSTEVLCGVDALEMVSAHEEAGTVVSAIVGAAGLLPTLSAVNSGKKVLIANKEPLVMCGDLILQNAKKSGAVILPVDSEHNAIFQCMPGNYLAGNTAPGVTKILLTGSGGPFRELSKEKIKFVTPEQACNHPNWSMGPKISVDSATMMNKGLELIEACHLFNLSHNKINIVIHPQSIVHSMVEYEDGSVLAQLGNPDMRTPIASALAWPNRISSGVENLDIFDMKDLTFEKPDLDKFPCLGIASAAATLMGTAPTAMNAANEVAVDAFLSGRINFNNISETIDHVMSGHNVQSAESLEEILEADKIARLSAITYLDEKSVKTG